MSADLSADLSEDLSADWLTDVLYADDDLNADDELNADELEILVDKKDVLFCEENKKINKISIEKIDEINKNHIHRQLDTVNKINNNYKVLDIIAILSKTKENDKKKIQKYKDDEVIFENTKCNGYTRKARFFTPNGIERYLNECKIIMYEQACDYFNIKPKNLEYEKWNIQLNKFKVETSSKVRYKTKSILKWLFESRKSTNKLNETVTIKQLIKWINTNSLEENIANKNKLKYLNSIM
jgi:hypothetical protein